MTLPNEEVINLLRDDFVVGYRNIKKEVYVGNSNGYKKNQTAVGTTNGAGGRNVQLFVLAADLTVLHVLPGFWHADDLIEELRFANQLHRLWCEDRLDRKQKLRIAKTMRGTHVRGLSPHTIARSSWQSFDEREEMERYRSEPRDTIVLDDNGRPKIRPVCHVVHDRMDTRVFTSFKDFDTETFVDYGRPYYDNNRMDRGREFPTAKRTQTRRLKLQEKERRRLARDSR